MSKGFYKNDNGSLLYAPNFVYSKDFSLTVLEKDTYTYPVEGWTWFETLEEACTFFGIEIPNAQTETDLALLNQLLIEEQTLL